MNWNDFVHVQYFTSVISLDEKNNSLQQMKPTWACSTTKQKHCNTLVELKDNKFLNTQKTCFAVSQKKILSLELLSLTKETPKLITNKPKEVSLKIMTLSCLNLSSLSFPWCNLSLRLFKKMNTTNYMSLNLLSNNLVQRSNQEGGQSKNKLCYFLHFSSHFK